MKPETVPLSDLSQAFMPCMSFVCKAADCANPQTVTAATDATPFGMASFIQRRTTDAAPTASNLMPAHVTLTTSNGQTLKIEGNESTIISFLTGLNFSVPETVAAPIVDATEQKALKYIDFLSLELNNRIQGGKFFVSELNRLRLQGNGYIPMNRVYRDLVNRKAAGWAKRRQLLKTASAIWRYTFAGQTELRGDILAAAECTDCGEFAQAMIERMKQEKLWV